MNHVKVYVLTSLAVNARGDVTCRNIGATFNVFEAETHRANGVENEFDTFCMASDWCDDAAQSMLIDAMREFRGMVEAMRDEALR